MPAVLARRSKTRARGFSLIELLVTIVILGILLAVVGQTVLQVQETYLTQRRLIEAQNNARTALDLMTRLIRQAGNDSLRIPGGVQAVTGQPNTIRIQSDWNPPDRDLADPYEDVTFSVISGALNISEGGAAPLPFLEEISQLQFTYFDTTGNPVFNPVGNPGAIVSVDIVMTSNVPGTQALPPFRASATIRGRE